VSCFFFETQCTLLYSNNNNYYSYYYYHYSCNMFVCHSPEGVPRLFDLVRVKDKSFIPVFYFALRDTLVADDLGQATRIAYGRTRHRVVTLAGQLIETSGTTTVATTTTAAAATTNNSNSNSRDKVMVLSS